MCVIGVAREPDEVTAISSALGGKETDETNGEREKGETERGRKRGRGKIAKGERREKRE